VPGLLASVGSTLGFATQGSLAAHRRKRQRMAAGEPPRRLLWLWFLCLLLVGTQQPAGGQQGYPRPTTAKDKQRLEEVVPQTSGADSVAGAELVPSLPGVPEESSLLLVTLLDGSLNAIDSQVSSPRA